MALSYRALNTCLLALALLAAQTVLVIHDAAPHGSTHTADCQLCAHASGTSHALPAPGGCLYPAFCGSQQPATFLRPILPARFHAPSARAPPVESA